ncbi:hypothetical protein [Planctomicrobium sp. SH664]|uniref:hypothetical protein n=1 Tax=Planctomicrobium sp. SH664 TaxID=3448125 RepID=UPI003F5B8ABF
MSSSSFGNANRNPAWLTGRGLGPRIKWHFGTDGPLTTFAYARESSDLFVADGAGTLYRLNRLGKIVAMTRLNQPLLALDWSDDGKLGAVILGEDQVLRFDENLQTVQRLTLPDTCLGLSVSPFGNHLVVGLANGSNLIFNERKRRIAQFETSRPLPFLKFCRTEAVIFGAAEHGLLCCHDLSGAEIWQQRNWANVGQMAATGDGDLIYLASFGHGIQALDGDGATVGSYVLDGTVKRIDVSFEPQRLIASTIERSLYWLDADGEMLWATAVDDDINGVICDPLGEWAIFGMAQQGIYRLDWGGL